MNILAIDTSTEYLSLAIMKDGRVIGRFHRRCAMRHSSTLIPMIDKLLKKVRLKIKEIGCFAFSIGPGSFTGLRIGVATVKGLAYALKKPVVTVPTLDVIARNVRHFNGIICPVLDARKNKVYSCIYRSDAKTIKRISPYLLLEIVVLKKTLASYDKICLLGDAAHLIERSFGCSYSSQPQDQITYSKIWHPKAEIAAGLAINEIKKKHFAKPEDLEPLYLYSRECDITGK